MTAVVGEATKAKEIKHLNLAMEIQRLWRCQKAELVPVVFLPLSSLAGHLQKTGIEQIIISAVQRKNRSTPNLLSSQDSFCF